MKRVLLIDPPWVVDNKDNMWSKIVSCLPSLGLAYIASMLEKHGHQVMYLDCTADQIVVNDVANILNQYMELDYIGITATTALIDNALKIAKDCKKKFPYAKIIMGGVHPSVLPDEVIRYDYVDYVVRDEGEITFVELCQDKEPKNILGLTWKKKLKNGNKIYHNKDRPLIKNLDDIPPPAYHLLPMRKYYPSVGNYKRLPAMSIFATRGCPAKCTFCHRAFGGVCRPRSARNIIKEIKILQLHYGIKEINFYDDTFTLFKKVIKEFCQIVRDEKIDITWSCFTRVDYVTKELLKDMKSAGCHLILFGVESANQKILTNIKKDIKLEQVKSVVRWCREIGIESRASFMFGNPGETVETMEETIQFALDLDPDEAQFNITTVYPGTEMYEEAKSLGILTKHDYSDYNMSEITMNLPTVTQDEIKEYYSQAHKRFYLRPKIILRRLFKIRSWIQLKQEVLGGLAVLGIKTFK